jgi:flagellar basal body-associated protein FliL
MTINWKIIIPVLVILVVAAGLIYYQFGIKPLQPQYTTEKAAPEQAAKITPPPATGNIDDAINAFIQDATNEQALAADEDADTSLIDLDSQAINDFGQSYNENEI